MIELALLIRVNSIWMTGNANQPIALAVTALEFRESDIGPYNEVAISVPFTLDKPSPHFTGVFREPSKEPKLFIRHLPVTT